jgi:spermidine/putrescine-binding protein
LSEAKYALHQAWSGDIISTPWYTPNPAEENGLIRYYWPARDGFGGVYDNDMLSIPKGAANPVLAHHFINYMLDNDHSMKNFSWTGYQAPLVALDAEDFIANGWPSLPDVTFSVDYEGHWDNLLNAIVTDEDVQIGDRFVGLPLDQETLWVEAFDDFKSGTQ